MRELKKADYVLFEQIVSMKQNTLLKLVYKCLKDRYKQVYATKDYVMAVGDIPIGLVAHLDTVFTTPVKDLYYDTRKNIMWSPQGLGADDRAGVFIIMKIIKMGLKPTVIFTTDEEKGCLGAMRLIRDIPDSPTPLKYLIQLDRRGTNDCVFYDCLNEEFISYIESFGFIEAWGSFSDICEICPHWGIAGVNLSVGYENEHNIIETLNPGVLLTTLDKVIEMLKASKKAPSFIYVPSPYSFGFFKYGMGLGFDDGPLNCSKCRKVFTEYELFPVKTLQGTTKFLCPDCLVGTVEWCEICGEAYEIDPSNKQKRKICRDCEKLTKEPIKCQN